MFSWGQKLRIRLSLRRLAVASEEHTDGEGPAAINEATRHGTSEQKATTKRDTCERQHSCRGLISR